MLNLFLSINSRSFKPILSSWFIFLNFAIFPSFKKFFVKVGESIAEWIAYLLLDPAAQGSNHYSDFFQQKFLMSIDRSALLRVIVDSAKSLIVY